MADIQRHFRADGIFVVDTKTGRKMTTQGAFEEARGLEAVAMQTKSLAVLEKVDDLYLAAWTVKGSPQTAPAPYVRGRQAASSEQSQEEKG